METATKESFSDVIRGEKPVLVDFHAEWCGPCKMMKPVLEELRKLLGDKIRIIKIDIDKNGSLSNSLNITGVPTLMLFQNGEVLWRQSGVQSAKQLQSVIQQKVKL